MSERDTYRFSAHNNPAEYCVFCENPVRPEGAEAEIVLMSDYVDTNLGEDIPGRRVGLCIHHAELLRERAPTTTELVSQ